MAVDATGRTATPLMLKENVRAVGRTRHRIIHRHIAKNIYDWRRLCQLNYGRDC